MSKPLSRYRTTVSHIGNRVEVTYIKTVIVTARPDTVTLHSGGWRSVTTKQKMTAAAAEFGLGFTVFQRRGEWFVCRLGRTVDGLASASPADGAIIMPFYDGITFARGTVNRAANAA